jgi:hypothetical protein
MAVFPSVAFLVVLYVINKERGPGASLKIFAFAATTALGLIALVLSPIYRAGAFRDFVGAYFGYNAAYSGSLSIAVRLVHTRQLIIQLFASGLAVLAIAGWSLALRKR